MYLGAVGAGGLAEYAYIYNLAAGVVAVEADILFDSNGVITSGILHTPGTSAITIVTAGDYSVQFGVSGVEPSQFAIFVNVAPVAGGIYGSGAGTQQNNGSGILTLAAGDFITIRNHSSTAAVTLQTLAGGTQINTNAFVLLTKLSA
jgi:hypothetical protein